MREKESETMNENLLMYLRVHEPSLDTPARSMAAFQNWVRQRQLFRYLTRHNWITEIHSPINILIPTVALYSSN